MGVHLNENAVSPFSGMIYCVAGRLGKYFNLMNWLSVGIGEISIW